MNKKQLLFVGVSVAIACALVATALFTNVLEPENTGLDVVVSFYPLAYMAEEIGGERVNVRSLIPYNTEVHTWSPSPNDIVAADNADILLYNGAGLDHWFEDDVLPALGQKERVVVETTEGLELIAGGDEHGEDEHDHGGYDPHTWLSPFMAQQQAEKIYDAFLKADPEGADYYGQRWSNFSAKLTDIDSRYMSSLANNTNGTAIVSHGAYGYLAHRYGFEQHGIIGLSADEQPSSSALADIADLMVNENLRTLYMDPIYSDAYVQTLKVELESRTGDDVIVLRLYLALGPTDGMDFLGQMEANLTNLERGLTG
ncbi:MAG: zinc ABC transporter substrate-binding protein [Thermoplasmata archaeon]|nr:zinc ABC transporter substrate-binding protein [Thermoplasmata archaeon]